MIITSSHIEKPVSLTIFKLEGKLDGSNYEDLIEEARLTYQKGVTDLLLDLSRLTFISSAGLSALHQVALLFRGDRVPDQDLGWASFHAIDRARAAGKQEHVKLFSPSQTVQKVLEMTGFGLLFETYTDLQEAIASFKAHAVPQTQVL